MKARAVKKLDPKGTLADNVQRIVTVRAAEVAGFMPTALDPAEVEALHDMRIAAKRLRYILELTGFCFGPYATVAATHAKGLQDLLGEIHDCDVTLPRVLALIEEQRDAAAFELRCRAGDAPDLEPALVAGLPGADNWRGLEDLATYLRARRTLLFERFVQRWNSLQGEGFMHRLAEAVAERAPAPAWVQGNGARAVAGTAAAGSKPQPVPPPGTSPVPHPSPPPEPHGDPLPVVGDPAPDGDGDEPEQP